MLYGNVIFIKKTGGDGSKCPVTDKSIKIGRSEDCVIRIYNNQVALEHCQLIIGNDGQATLKDLCNQTVLNGNLLVHGEVTLCHGDVFKVGERLARWEYLPTSKYYREVLPSTQATVRLVAVVMPQQRSLDDVSMPGTSGSATSVLKNTPVGRKRRCSERFSSAENTLSVKVRKSSGSDLTNKNKNFSKVLIGRHSLKTTKLSLPAFNIKDRKNSSGIINLKTKGKSRKSTLPSWKVNIVTPPSKLAGRNCSAKSQRKSENSSQSTDFNLQSSLEPTFATLSDAKRKIKTPQRFLMTSQETVKSASKSIPMTPLKIVKESTLRSGQSLRSVQSFSKSSSPKKSSLVSTPSSKPLSVVHSEKRPKFNLMKSAVSTREFKRLSLVLNRVDNSQNVLDQELHKNFTLGELNGPRKSGLGSDLTIIPKGSEKTPKKCSVIKVVNTSQHKVKIKRTNATKKGIALEKMGTPTAKETNVQTLIKLDFVANSEEKRQIPQVNIRSIKTISVKKTPQKLENSIEKLKSSSLKTLSKTISSASSSHNGTLNSLVQDSTSARSSKLSPVRASARKKSLLKERTSSPKGVRRELSPSISSAERAAKKLKTSSPKKPDKNKKAALLVLGKASRKQLLSQNVKVLLKQKIVKKAIKQSTTANSQKSDSNKIASVMNVKSKPKKGFLKTYSKPKMKGKKKNVSSKEKTPTKSLKSAEVFFQGKNKMETIPKSENVGENSPNDLKVNEPRSPSKQKDSNNKGSGKSTFHQYKKAESPRSVLFKTHSEEMISPYGNYEKTAENFLLNSNRRCSKRLSSKNDTGRPDFIELSPTALGLIPKYIEVFKTPKQNKRRSSSLVTPKINQSIGIIKSASTSKIANRKSVRFSSKDFSINSEFFRPSLSEKTDFGIYQTPDVSLNAFISPVEDDNNASKKSLSESSKHIFSPEDISEIGFKKVYKSNSEPRKCVRKLLQSPKTKQKKPPVDLRSSERKSPAPIKNQDYSASAPEKFQEMLSNVMSSIKAPTTPKIQKSPRNRATSIKGVHRLVRTPKHKKGLKNDLKDVKGVKKLLTPKVQNSPKNDLSDLRGVKKLLATPKIQKSPKNDLSDLRGVKKLLTTPKVQKSPKNNLSDLRGVKKLLTTPKVQKSPKNNLSDLKGVKKLLTTPKVQKSPKNNLTDLRGVKKLLTTPRVQKGPKNDLSDLRGVKKLLATPKVQKSPKNNLSDLRGVKKLLATPKVRKSPKNDLSDLRGVKKLLTTPKVQKSPKNNLTNLGGVKKLLTAPKAQKSPKNDLSDLRGVKKLLTTPRVQKSPKNNLSDLRGVKKLLATPKVRKSPKNNLTNLGGVKKLLTTPKAQKSPKNDLTDLRGVKKLLTTPKVQKSPKSDLTDIAGVKELMQSPKNELSNVNEVQQLLGSLKLKRSLKNDCSTSKEVKKESPFNFLKENSVGSSKIRKLNRSSAEDEKESSKSSQSGRGVAGDLVKQLLVAESSESFPKSEKTVPRKSNVNDFRAVRGRRTIYSSPKGPKNDFSNATGVGELFSRHESNGDYNKSFTGVAQLFDLPEAQIVSTTKTKRATKKSIKKAQQVSRALRSEKTTADEVGTQSGRLGKETLTEATTKKSLRGKKSKAEGKIEVKSTERKPTKRKFASRTISSRPVKSPAVVTRSRRVTKEAKKSEKTLEVKAKTASKKIGETKNSRKRKAAAVDTAPSPPKLRKKLVESGNSASSVTKTIRKTTSRSKTSASTKKMSRKSTEKTLARVKAKMSKVQCETVDATLQFETSSKRSPKVQNKRSRSSSKKILSDRQEKTSPVKTRRARKESVTQKLLKAQSAEVENKACKSTGRRKKVLSVVKKSTRLK